MGRQRWTSRLTVEECFSLNVNEMCRAGVFNGSIGARWRYCWPNALGNTAFSVDYTLEEFPGVAMALKLQFEVRDQPKSTTTSQRVKITTTCPYLGGRRFWFQCPKCGKRVGCLFLPTGGQAFACRLCYYLTYRSSQTHDKRVNALAADPVALVSALSSNDHRKAFLGIDASVQVLKRFKRLKQRSPREGRPRNGPVWSGR
jgi:hypothetical protein